MAAIVQSDPYGFFIRKIGYSVGLESTFSRVLDVVKLYVSKKEISTSAWEELVHSEAGWGLRNEHIADFFRSIDVIFRRKGEVLALPCLDALALAYVELNDERKFQNALRLILGSHLVLADGDIFLNFLAGAFLRDRVEPLLKLMIKAKRAALSKVTRTPQILEKILRTISIDVQATNVGGASSKQVLSDQIRRDALKPRTESLSQRIDPNRIDISEDYFRKVTGRRKDWAKSMELCLDDGSLTTKGKRFLESFEKFGLVVEDSAFAYWPFSSELEKVALSPKQLGIPDLHLWGHLLSMRNGLALDVDGEEVQEETTEEVLRLLRRMSSTYQTLSPKRHMLRREVPIGVLLHAGTGYYAAANKILPPIQKIILDEGANTEGILAYRRSKNVQGSVLFRN